MSFISAAGYFGETSVAFGGYSTVQMELDCKTLGLSFADPKSQLLYFRVIFQAFELTRAQAL